MYVLTWMLQAIVWIPARLCFLVFTRIKIKGKEHLKGLAAPVIFASNHPSEVDPLLLPMVLQPFSPFFPTFYVAKKQNEYINLGLMKRFIYGGWFFKIWGAYPTYRGQKDYGHSLREHVKLLEDGNNVQIFLDGHLSPEDVLFSERAHGGTAYLAWKTQRDVVPFAIKGTYKTSVVDFFLRRKRYVVAFGKPFSPDELVAKGDGVTEPEVETLRNGTRKVIERVRELHRGL